MAARYAECSAQQGRFIGASRFAVDCEACRCVRITREGSVGSFHESATTGRDVPALPRMDEGNEAGSVWIPFAVEPLVMRNEAGHHRLEEGRAFGIRQLRSRLVHSASARVVS